jgi:hypothetical protein
VAFLFSPVPVLPAGAAVLVPPLPRVPATARADHGDHGGHGKGSPSPDVLLMASPHVW